MNDSAREPAGDFQSRSRKLCNEQPLLVFVHLRKTAGSTIRFVMSRQFRSAEEFTLNAPTVEAANQIWNATPPEQRARIKSVRGHFPYAPSLFAPRLITCFTMLRDPVERVISEYYFNLRNPEMRFHTALVREHITLEQFVNGERFAEVHNTQTRMLAGGQPDAGPSRMLDAAISNLRDRMALVGVSDRLDETLLLCRAILGWRRLVYRRVNVNPRRPSLDSLAPTTVSTIERANSLDRTLYRCACEELDELMDEHHIPDSAVLALSRLSSVYGAARRTVGFPRELWQEAQMAIARRRIALNR
jgi:hypothetical protein